MNERLHIKPRPEAEMIDRWIHPKAGTAYSSPPLPHSPTVLKHKRQMEAVGNRTDWRSWRAAHPGLNYAEALAHADGVTTEIDAPDSPAQPRPPRAAPLPSEPRKGFCQHCDKRLPLRAPAGTKFCPGSSCRTAAFRKQAARLRAEQVFAEAERSAKAAAAAAYTLAVNRAVAAELLASADRCGLTDVAFVATPVGILAFSDEALPEIRFRIHTQSEGEEYLRPVRLTVEMHTIGGNMTSSHPDVEALLRSVNAELDGPERRAILLQFDLPSADQTHVGVAEMELRFRGDPGTGFMDGFETETEVDAVAGARVWEAIRRGIRDNPGPYVRPAHGRKEPNRYF